MTVAEQADLRARVERLEGEILQVRRDLAALARTLAETTTALRRLAAGTLGEP